MRFLFCFSEVDGLLFLVEVLEIGSRGFGIVDDYLIGFWSCDIIIEVILVFCFLWL